MEDKLPQRSLCASSNLSGPRPGSCGRCESQCAPVKVSDWALRVRKIQTYLHVQNWFKVGHSILSFGCGNFSCMVSVWLVENLDGWTDFGLASSTSFPKASTKVSEMAQKVGFSAHLAAGVLGCIGSLQYVLHNWYTPPPFPLTVILDARTCSF